MRIVLVLMKDRHFMLEDLKPADGSVTISLHNFVGEGIIN
jgi:hypothetical protein